MSTDNWCTPKWLAYLLGEFDLDPCSNASSHIRARYVCQLDAGPGLIKLADGRDSIGDDGLAQDWGRHSAFVNPPYSNPLPWAKKLAAHNAPWCALLKLDPTTRWWAALMETSPTIAPFRKRLTFEGEKAMTANFPSVLVYSAWRPCAELAARLWLPTYARAA